MKKLLSALLLFAMLATVMCGCVTTPAESSAPQSTADTSSQGESSMTNESSAESSVEESSETPIIPDENAKLIWKSDYAYGSIASASDVAHAAVWYNGAKTDNYSVKPSAGDCKYFFEGRTDTRVINNPEGYALTLPGAVEPDFSLAELRSKYNGDGFCLTVTSESGNPYGNTPNGWNTYNTEWLSRYIADNGFLAANNLRRLGATKVSTELVSGCETTIYSIQINDNSNIEMPFYNIAIIRPVDEYVKFTLFVMKSTKDMREQFKEAVGSFTAIAAAGTSRNIVGSYELKKNPDWDEATAAYYDQMMAQDTVDWGFYHLNLESKGTKNYYAQQKKIGEWLEWMESDEGLSYKSKIYPTYLGIGWYDDRSNFPVDQALEFAGGDGKNGKPVLQVTYHFTNTNNTNLNGYTPMYDIMRGKFDSHFRRIAGQIKNYGAPVWFRLNNEMNSDWTSYTGILTMLDPDVFIMTWQRLYEIFREEGVTNCIFVFNPIAISVPYSSWGSTLNYFPGSDYAQALGMTYYEMLNDRDSGKTFREMYTALYNQNMPYFANYPWVIGEFGCASGGEVAFNWDTDTYDATELARNADMQAKWIKDMLAILANKNSASNEFISRLKYAVWFSVNDYAEVGGESKITNYLDFSDSPTAIKALREGLAGGNR